MKAFQAVATILLLIGSVSCDTSGHYEYDPNTYQANSVSGSTGYSADYSQDEGSYAAYAGAEGDAAYYANDPYATYDTEKTEINLDPFGIFSNTNRQGGLEVIGALPLMVGVFGAALIGALAAPLVGNGLKRMAEGFELPSLNLPRIRYIVESSDSDSAFENLPWVLALEEAASGTSTKTETASVEATDEAEVATARKRWVK